MTEATQPWTRRLKQLFSWWKKPGAIIRLSGKGQPLLTPPSWLLYGCASVLTASSLARSFEALSQVKCSGAPLRIKALHKARSLQARLGDWQCRKKWSKGRDRQAGDEVGVGVDYTDWPLSMWHGFKASVAQDTSQERFSLQLQFLLFWSCWVALSTYMQTARALFVKRGFYVSKEDQNYRYSVHLYPFHVNNRKAQESKTYFNSLTFGFLFYSKKQIYATCIMDGKRSPLLVLNTWQGHVVRLAHQTHSSRYPHYVWSEHLDLELNNCQVVQSLFQKKRWA